MSEPRRPLALSGRYRPAAHEVDALIAQAETHPLGVAFLVKGALDAVAATFQVHAAVVEEARERLRSPGPRRG